MTALLLASLIAAVAANISLVAYAADRLSPNDGTDTAVRSASAGKTAHAA